MATLSRKLGPGHYQNYLPDRERVCVDINEDGTNTTSPEVCADHRAHNQKESEALEGIKDKIWRIPVADGFAEYYVESVDPPVLRHLPIGDAYTAHPALIRGLTGAEIQADLDREVRIQELFAKKQEDQPAA